MKKDRKSISQAKKAKQKEGEKEIVQIYPMMPREYNSVERAKLRAFEKELLTGRKIDIEPSKNKNDEGENKMDQKKYLFGKINSLLKSDANMTVNNWNGVSPEERKARLEAIEEIKHYIDNYDENMKIINRAKEEKFRMEDDKR